MTVPPEIEQLLAMVVDPVWYRARHKDVTGRGMDPVRHFIEHGLAEYRDPNPWFDSAWYLGQNPDAAAAGMHPLLHYLTEGQASRRDPHPQFDTDWYLDQHPEAAGNPMLFHLRVGANAGWLTEAPVTIGDWLPATAPMPVPPDIPVDIIIPVYRDFALTRRCLNSVRDDKDRPAGSIVVIDDRAPDPALSAWLDAQPDIVLIRNRRNLGFVASVNLGLAVTPARDAVLLNSDTEVPAGWLRRLQAQAYAAERIASVSPLSNNATICTWPSFAGGPLPGGMTVTGLDAACRAANAGRYAEAPTTVGFCMYLRRAALDETGAFDAKTFGKGYGEENDFCLRAAALGWTHRIACDVFVRHEGGASFGDQTSPRTRRAFSTLTRLHPRYPALVERFVRADPLKPFRFALTMALFRASGLPMVLLIAHDHAGGVARHITDTIAQNRGKSHYLLLRPDARGVVLSVPDLLGHPTLALAADRWRDIAAVARSGGVTRVHIHHLMGFNLDVRALIHGLGVPFDVTVHDYFALCPQVTMLPVPWGAHCGEPGPAGCDACIAVRPSHGATDILSWRLRWSWQFHEAETVFAPSLDCLARLRRYGAGDRATYAPHEAPRDLGRDSPRGAGRSPGPPPRPAGRSGREPLRVAILGTLANHKGAHVAASVVLAAKPDRLRLHLLGDTETDFPTEIRTRMRVSGAYQEGDLPALLAKHRPDMIWFPAAWPETYSYTLSAALDSGLPIVAADIGAFRERLAGRALTWLHPPTMDPGIWLDLLERAARTRTAPKVMPPPPVPATRGRAAAVHAVVIPERFDDGMFTPCAHIRLLRPLDHPVASAGLAVTVTDLAGAARYRPDIILTQRHAIGTVAEAEALAAHAKRAGARLIYDLDDDLLHVPPDHPDAATLIGKTAAVRRMVRLADVVRVSTVPLAERMRRHARRIIVVENALDERIWCRNDPAPAPVIGAAPSRGSDPSPPPGTEPSQPCDADATRSRDANSPSSHDANPVRILCMGTATHDADLALILPALAAIRRDFGDRIGIDLIGFAANLVVPDWIRRVAPTPHATRSYGGFVHWLTGSRPWDIGLAPLADTAFNACKSPIKVMDYAACGLAVLASDVPAYRGALADGRSGWLVRNTRQAWYAALSRLIRDPAARRALADGAAAWLRREGTLASQPRGWLLGTHPAAPSRRQAEVAKRAKSRASTS